MLRSVESVLLHAQAKLDELQETVFMRPPNDMVEFARLQGQFQAYHDLCTLLKEGTDEEGKR